MAYLNQCYLSYYLRSGLDHDQVVFSNHQGRLQARDFRPMLVSLYDNDPLQFPFNWDNFEKKTVPQSALGSFKMTLSFSPKSCFRAGWVSLSMTRKVLV